MSLTPIEMKSSKRLSTIGPGTHLCIIYKVYYLRNAAKTKVLADGKFDIMEVVFTKDKGKEFHEQHYVIDGGWRQQLFKDMIMAANVTSKIEGAPPKIMDAPGHRLWLSIKAVCQVNDGVAVLEDGEPMIEHFIFKVNPYIDNGKKPKIAGDPADNNGIASGAFIEHVNINVTKPLIEHITPLAEATHNAAVKINTTIEKAKVISDAKKMIKNVESGIKVEKPVEQPKIQEDIDWEETPNF